MICYFIELGYFRQRRKKAAKGQVAAAHLKLDESELPDYNISADEFEEEEDKLSSILDIISADIDDDIPSETDWEDENDDIEEDEMETAD